MNCKIQDVLQDEYHVFYPRAQEIVVLSKRFSLSVSRFVGSVSQKQEKEIIEDLIENLKEKIFDEIFRIKTI